ncbi:MAG TPA: TlpA disulfide reductase family protein [Rectinemataceae bacterium]|nr:TlpA disulfide reductase family protein [Rectinemataceae bacterium]
MHRSTSWLGSLVFSALLACAGATGFGQTAAPSAAPARPWYADRLAQLGFTVFPKPVPIDDFSVQALAGNSVKLSDQRGKVVLLNFWATWCPPCQAEMPAIETLWKKSKSAAFTVMGVSVGEEPATVKGYIARKGYSYPVFVDPQGTLGTAFGARSIPTTFVIDKSGRAIAGIVGGAAYDGTEAEALFAELAAR